MRRAAFFAFLAIFALLVPAAADAQNNVNFGGRYCSQHFSCDSGDPTYPNPAQLIAMANNCTGSIGVFNSSYGLDGNGCMTADVSSLPASAMTVPQCCVKEIGGRQCALYCALLSR